MRFACLILCALLASASADEKADVAALDRINVHRKAAGLQPVALDPALSKGCALHAQYLLRNRAAPQCQGLGAHREDPKLPGYTPEGAQAGISADIAFQPPESSAEAWINTLFHRVPLLDPALKTVGLGYAHNADGWVSVLDVMRGNLCSRPTGVPILYPGDGEKGVPCAFIRYEIPDPLPKEAQGYVAGYPVTTSFEAGVPVKEAKAVLKDADGKEVACWLSTPEKPADPVYQRNTICLIAKEPLKPRTAYTVQMSAKAGGKPWAKTWTFTTGEREELP